MKEPRILILVLAIDKDPWKKIEIYGQAPTWRKNPPKNIQVFRYVGSTKKTIFWTYVNRIWNINQKIFSVTKGKISPFSINRVLEKNRFLEPSIDLKNQEILTKVPDLYSLIGIKTLEAFEASLKNFDFDYIYRTNASSYIDLDGLNEFLRNKPIANFYAGVVGNYQGISFASGCGYFISRDLVEKVIQKKNRWDHSYIDDVSLGKLLTREMNIAIQMVKRVDLNSEIVDLVKIENIKKSIFHFRCKAANPDTTISIMKTLHKIGK